MFQRNKFIKRIILNIKLSLKTGCHYDHSKLITDPRILGPSAWTFIHIKAKMATDEQTFIDEMYFHYYNFPCLNCRKHIQEYMNTHPFEHFSGMTNSSGRQIGMFRWSWLFHNTVNQRLEKPYMDWDTACEMYEINEDTFTPCTNCGTDTSVDKTKIVQGYFLKHN